MCDQATAQEIETTVQAWVQQRKAFTAFDVTQDVKKRVGTNERHGQMKRVVHDVFGGSGMADYSRTLVQFASAPRPCFLYHPPEIDPNIHVQSVQAGQPATAGAIAAPATTATGSDDDDDDDDDEDEAVEPADKTLNADAQVLYVPTKMAQALKIDPSGTAYMTVGSDKLSITNAPTGADSKTVHVDRNQNIRVGKTAMNKIGIDGKVHIEVDGKEIVISKA